MVNWSRCQRVGSLLVWFVVVTALLLPGPVRSWAQDPRGPGSTGIVRPESFLSLDAQFATLVPSISGGLANAVGSLPNPTGGGFAYRLDPALGVFQRATESFGPVFTDRAETTGRGKFTFTLSYTPHTFDEVDGKNLRNGDVNFVLLGDLSPFGPGPPIRANIISLREDIRADVVTLGAIYGVTDFIDVGLTVPIVKVKIKDRFKVEGFRDCPAGVDGRDLSTCGPFTPTGTLTFAEEAEATGIGDITLRGKYNFANLTDVWGGLIGLTTSLDVKLPTGDEGDRKRPRVLVGEQFNPSLGGDPPLGTGIVRVKPLLIASGSWFGPWFGVSPHVDVGFELGTTTGVTNDFVYAVGVDVTVLRRATFVLDLLGRHALSVDRAKVGSFGLEKADADNLALSFGAKVNPIGSLLVFVNFLVPLDDTGLRDDLTPTFGLEWSF